MDNIDLLLIELNKKLNTEIIISEESKYMKIQYSFIPTEITFNPEGLYISDKNNYYFWIKDIDKFELNVDDTDDCLEFSFRDYKQNRYYGICL